MENFRLLKKLQLIQNTVLGLSKNEKGFNYTYVTGDKILSVIKPLMSENNLILIQDIKSINNEIVTYEQYSKVRKQFEKKTEVLTTLVTTFTWVCTESGETLSVNWCANGMNDFDKGVGSAMTYGERYFLLKFFHIATDKDDVDANQIERGVKAEVIKEIQDTLGMVNVTEVLDNVSKAETIPDLAKIWDKSYGNDNDIKTAFSKKREELEDYVIDGINKSTTIDELSQKWDKIYADYPRVLSAFGDKKKELNHVS